MFSWQNEKLLITMEAHIVHLFLASIIWVAQEPDMVKENCDLILHISMLSSVELKHWRLYPAWKWTAFWMGN